MESIFMPYVKDFIFEEVQKRNFEESVILDSWSNLLNQNIISLEDDLKNTYILNRNYLNYECNDICEEKMIELMKRYYVISHNNPCLHKANSCDKNNVYYSIMLECQKTKTFQMINQIFKILGINLFSKEVLCPTTNKKMFFLVSQNMQDLTSQNCERILNDLGEYLQIFVFTSQNEKKNKNQNILFNPKIEDVITYMLHYLNEDEESLKIPMAIFLANPNQINKMNTLLEVVEIKNNQISKVMNHFNHISFLMKLTKHIHLVVKYL
jgi:hypothetical protein